MKRIVDKPFNYNSCYELDVLSIFTQILEKRYE